MARSGFTPTQLAARASYLLRGNDLGTMTSAAPRLYPHMWSWDAAFVAVGLAPLSVERAVIELDTLLSAQWSARRGWAERSFMLRAEGLRQASDGSFAEYYEPFTGEPLGSMQQSWTAASVLDWLG